MKVHWKGFDPNIGREYAESPVGQVILRPKRSRSMEESMPIGLDAQEQHDWLLSQRRSKSLQSEDDGVDPEPHGGAESTRQPQQHTGQLRGKTKRR
jgi:hypothetical protein